MRKYSRTWVRIWIVLALSMAFGLTYAVCVSFGDIIIDGEIDDREWKDAQEFVFSSKDPKYEITALVKWDEEYFYFACRIDDPDVQGNHVEGIQNVWEDDDVEYYLETDNEKHNGRSVNSYQLLFGAAGAYNDTVGNGTTYDFTWDSSVEYVVALAEGTTINDSKDTDAGWRVESRLLWEDMDVDGREVKGETMGWNILVAEQPGSKPISWSEKVLGWNNNHDCSAWGEITFDEGYVSIEPRGKLSATWGVIKVETSKIEP
jgi:hypothetical protein